MPRHPSRCAGRYCGACPVVASIEGAGSIPLSNVMLFSDKLARPVRTGAVETSDGKKKLRVARGKKLKAEEV